MWANRGSPAASTGGRSAAVMRRRHRAPPAPASHRSAARFPAPSRRCLHQGWRRRSGPPRWSPSARQDHCRPQATRHHRCPARAAAPPHREIQPVRNGLVRLARLGTSAVQTMRSAGVGAAPRCDHGEPAFQQLHDHRAVGIDQRDVGQQRAHTALAQMEQRFDRADTIACAAAAPAQTATAAPRHAPVLIAGRGEADQSLQSAVDQRGIDQVALRQPVRATVVELDHRASRTCRQHPADGSEGRTVVQLQCRRGLIDSSSR